MADEDLPEPDALPGAAHPRHTARLFGQEAAEAAVLGAMAAGRVHSGWLIAGPRGVGKATLAWRMARALLSGGAAGTLDWQPDTPDNRQLSALSHPRLSLIRRTPDPRTGRMRKEITVDTVRGLAGFFGMSATDGGARVVIVDSADELNRNAANAILKLLEEPPPNAHLLLVSHAPSRLLPTIRSRCRRLDLGPLGADDLEWALAQALPGGEAGDPVVRALAEGSVGRAVTLIETGGAETYGRLLALLSAPGRIDRAGAIALAEKHAGRSGDGKLAEFTDLLSAALARIARIGAGAPLPPLPGEAEAAARLAGGPRATRAIAGLAIDLGERARAAEAVNLDPATVILDMLLTIDRTAGTAAA